MNDISNTALVTLRCHIEDAESTTSILNDSSSLKAYGYLEVYLDEEAMKILAKTPRKSLVRHTAMRAKKYDSYVTRYLEAHPEATIVNIGSGLDDRFARIDNGKCLFYDIDLPDIIGVKKEIFPETDRYRQLGQSVFDFDWMQVVPPGPLLLLAEGVFMYCAPSDVKALFREIHERHPGSTMAFEVFNSKWLKGWKGKMVDFKLRKQLKFGEDASFRFGIADSDEIERWSEHYTLIEDWSYIDEVKPNAKDSIRKIQWTVYYHIN